MSWLDRRKSRIACARTAGSKPAAVASPAGKFSNAPSGQLRACAAPVTHSSASPKARPRKQYHLSFDHLVGAGKERGRDFKAEDPRCFSIDYQLQPRWLFDRQIRW